MSDDKIKKLPVRNKQKDSEGLFLVEKPQYYQCMHDLFLVDETAGKVECRQCGEEVSPIFVLTKLARQESLWMRNRDRYMDEMERLSKRAKTKCHHCGKMTPISRK